jgi:hypothetical protein
MTKMQTPEGTTSKGGHLIPCFEPAAAEYRGRFMLVGLPLALAAGFGSSVLVFDAKG